MKYEIKYKTKYLPGWDGFPVIVICYRRCGKLFWNRIKEDLDKFAHSKGLGDYESYICIYWIDKEDRVKMFKQVLDGSFYNGSLDAYVRSIVFDRIETKMDDKKRLCETETIISAWVTSGWKSIDIDFCDLDEVKQHSSE